MARNTQHWLNNSANYSPEGEPTVVLPEEFRAGTSIQPSVALPQSGRVRGSEKLYRKTYVQYEEREGKPFVHPTLPKVETPTLKQLLEKLGEVEAELTAAAEKFEAEKNTPDTRIADLEAEIARLQALLAEKTAALNSVKAEGNALDRVSRAIDGAEKSVSGLAGATTTSAVIVDCERVFQVASKFVPKASLDGLRVRHDLALRHLLPQVFIQLSGNTLDNAAVERHGARVSQAIQTVENYLKKLLSEKTGM